MIFGQVKSKEKFLHNGSEYTKLDYSTALSSSGERILFAYVDRVIEKSDEMEFSFKATLKESCGRLSLYSLDEVKNMFVVSSDGHKIAHGSLSSLKREYPEFITNWEKTIYKDIMDL